MLVLDAVVADDVCIESLCYLALYAVECTAADEEDVACIDVDVVLVGMLSAAFWRDVDNGAFEQLEQSLLYAFAAYVAGDAGVVLLACYLVYLVDEDDASLCCGQVVVGHLQQSGQDAFHVFAHVACLGEDGGIHDGEGHVEELGDGACHEGFSCACGSHHDDVALLDLYVVVLGL